MTITENEIRFRIREAIARMDKCWNESQNSSNAEWYIAALFDVEAILLDLNRRLAE